MCVCMCVWCGEDPVKIGTIMLIRMHRLSINMVSIGLPYCQATLNCRSKMLNCLLEVSLTTTSPHPPFFFLQDMLSSWQMERKTMQTC
jgi:hypothetical protein